MPFLSKQQSKACFATHGFGNKVNCDEWAKATNYKNLPDEVKQKKMKHLRPKKQKGGIYNLDGSWSPGYYDKKTDSWVSTGADIPAQNHTQSTTQFPTEQNLAWMNTTPITGSTNNPYSANLMTPTQEFHGEQAEGYDDFTNGLLPEGTNTSATMGTTAAQSNTPKHNTAMDIFLGLRGSQMAASFLAEKKRNALMNDYDYKQQTALGQMTPMPVSQFQFSNNDYTTPNHMYAQEGGTMNPYLYHSKYGGNLKTILREHGKWTNDAGPMDMTDGNLPRYPERKKGGFALDEMVVHDFISKLMQFGSGPHPYSGMHSGKAQDGGDINDINQENMTLLRRGGNPAKRQMVRHQQAQHAQHGQQQGQQQQIMQIIQMYAQMTGKNPKQLMQQLQQMQPQQQQAAIQQMAQAVQQAQSSQQGQQQQGQMQQQPQQGQQMQQGMQGDTDQDQMATGGNWMRGAVNPAHKGFCTPLSNPKCTGHRRAFALLMKKHHGFHGE